MRKQLSLLSIFAIVSGLTLLLIAQVGHIELVLFFQLAVGTSLGFLLDGRGLWLFTKLAFFFAALNSLVVSGVLDWLTFDGIGRLGELLALVFVVCLPFTMLASYAGYAIVMRLRK